MPVLLSDDFARGAPPVRAGLARLCLAALVSTVLAGCGTFNNASSGIANMVTPYKIDVVQGNFVSKEQVAALQTGMTRNQVRDVLGSPLLTSVFHGDRWDYVFTIRRQGVEPLARKLAVFFKGDALERFEGDEMPSEAEFVSKLASGRKLGKAPVLEATEDELKRFTPTQAAAPARDVDSLPPAATSYPPLESPAR